MTPILPYLIMTNDRFHMHASSYLFTTIWISKDRKGPHECRPMILGAKNVKILAFNILLYILDIFLSIMYGAMVLEGDEIFKEGN